MNRLKLIAFVLVTVCFGIGCQQVETEVRFWDLDQTVKRSEGDWVLIDGDAGKEKVQEGLWRTWYDNGIQESEMTFVRGKRVGHCRFYYENGQIRQEMFFNTRGRLDGEITWWKSDGEVLKTSKMKDGTGSDFYFNEDYSMRKEIRYVGGEVKEQILYE